MGKKDTSLGEAIAPTMLTPADIQQKEFRVSRFGGYKMRDVDEFLDQITDSVTALTAEIDRLRSGGAAPVVGTPDLDDVSRQADEIIARARAEAARITAEARAASGAASAGTVPGADPQDRAAVTAFIERERSFLQSLAGLVQEHAETMKSMARTSRRTPGSPPSSSAATADASRAREPASGAAPREPAKEATGASEATDAQAGAPASDSGEAVSSATPAAEETPSEAPAPPEAGDTEDTVRIEEPATAGAARREREPDGDRSLRELFWGED